MSGPGQLASESFTASFRDAHPDVPTDVRPVADVGVDDRLGRRIAGGDPPGAVGTVPGGNLAPFDGSLAAVDDAWTGDLADAHPPVAHETCRRDGGYRAVPVAAFRVDTVYYSVDVLDAAGVDPASLSSSTGSSRPSRRLPRRRPPRGGVGHGAAPRGRRGRLIRAASTRSTADRRLPTDEREPCRLRSRSARR
ncbi:hypothetical protein [Halorarum halobium]|uniref:hypothetical protein n=1 Tax=Halorarum halobium TaxID=3075121 RepID=UPI0028B04509|nr:hypothetical protein [Halobaculum sp. XH14]